MKTSFWRRWSNSLQVAKAVWSVSGVRPRRRRLALQALEERVTLSLTPQMVLDINATTQSSGPSRMTAVGSTMYFVADDGVHGRELWKSDGTDEGTVLVKDIYPGIGDEFAITQNLTNVDGTLFFTVDDGTHGAELWKSDGTAAGTVLVKDIYPGGYGSGPYLLTNVNGTLFFSAYSDPTGFELWKSDGTEVGTVLVKDVNPGWESSSPRHLTNVNGTLFFMTYDYFGTIGQELWKSDGTEAGTVLVKEIYAGSEDGYSPRGFTSVNETLFFAAYADTTGWELWKSDGTAAGTGLLRELAPGTESSFPENLTSVNGTLFFSAEAYPGSTGRELWKSDGSAAGTVLVKDIVPGTAGSDPGILTDVGGTLYFTARQGLWKSDGTAAGTLLVAAVDASNLTDVDGTLFFTVWSMRSGSQLWRTDGTAAGTLLVKDIWRGAGYYSPSHMTNVNGTLFLSANDGAHGVELWKSDGTAVGTTLVKDVNTRTFGSFPGGIADVNGTLFFAANDGVHGTELWKSDGTVSGTTLVKDVFPGGYHVGYYLGYYPNSSSPSNLTNVNGTLFFTTWSPSTGSQLWKSDGTETGTEMVRAGNSAWNLTDVDGTLFFTSYDHTQGTELWKSDGTAAGTTLVKDIYPGSSWVYYEGYYGGWWNYVPNSSSPTQLTNFNGKLFFVANDGAHGWELWQSDGTEAGTELFTDWPGANDDGPFHLTDVGGTLFFRANDGAHGSELWKSDGTTAGTVLVKDISPGNYSSDPHNLINVDGTLMFAAHTASTGYELWKSDGTAAGTVLVKDINPGHADSYPGTWWRHKLANVNGTLFFNADDGTHGYELWKSDGTEAGTTLVKDMFPGSGYYWESPYSLTNVNGTLYFMAHDSAIWRSDGTESGTVGVMDSLSVSSQSLINVNGTLFLVADDGIHGVELWKVSSDADTTGPIAEQVIVNQGLVDPPDLPGSGQPTRWSQQRSDLRRIEIVFNEPVQAQVSDIRLFNLGLDAGQDPPREIALTEDHFRLDGASVVLEFAPGELPDGVYAVEVASTVSDLHGNPLSNGGLSQTITGNEQNGLFRLAGDWNGDGGTSIFDFATLAYWFGRSTPTAPEYLDLNQDLGVSIFDFVLFARAFNNQVRFAPGLGPTTESLAALSPVWSTPDDDRLDTSHRPTETERRRAAVLHEYVFDEGRRLWRTDDRPDIAQRRPSGPDDGESDRLQGPTDDWLEFDV